VSDRTAPTPRVLVVEDEPLISALAVEELNDCGFLAEEAATAAEAIDKLRAAAGSFAAVIIDVGLPDRRGDALAEDLRALWPELRIVIATGYDGTELARRFAADPWIRLVAKPYAGDALQVALGDVGITPGPAG
jgi:CheY-like chemotaxis protein